MAKAKNQAHEALKTGSDGTTRVMIRLHPSVLEKVDEEARKQNRSRANYVETLILETLGLV